jgi:hypothetical protein
LFIFYVMFIFYLLLILGFMSLDGARIRMAGFMIAADMAVVAGARPAGGVPAPEVVDVEADAPEAVPAQGVLVLLGPP